MTIGYTAVLDVFGPTSTHQWLMQVALGDGNRASSGAATTSPFNGGTRFTFNATVRLTSSSDVARVATENVIDAESDPVSSQYTQLSYENGGRVITSADCHSPS